MRGRCITRQRCRVRIETTADRRRQWLNHASPGSDAGCGLKHLGALSNGADLAASPGSDAGCGLKRLAAACARGRRRRITRQRCRVRIETRCLQVLEHVGLASPGSDAGCGLKPVPDQRPRSGPYASPGSDAGCGLKPPSPGVSYVQSSITRQRCRVRIETTPTTASSTYSGASPGSDAGCGLKHKSQQHRVAVGAHHPAAMPGAD